MLEVDDDLEGQQERHSAPAQQHSAHRVQSFENTSLPSCGWECFYKPEPPPLYPKVSRSSMGLTPMQALLAQCRQGLSEACWNASSQPRGHDPLILGPRTLPFVHTLDQKLLLKSPNCLPLRLRAGEKKWLCSTPGPKPSAQTPRGPFAFLPGLNPLL